MKFYFLDKSYLTFLEIEKKIMTKHNRPYVGIVLSVNNINYFAPMSSSKAFSHKYHDLQKLGLTKPKRQNHTFVRLISHEDDYLGVVHLNNMVPIVDHTKLTVIYPKKLTKEQFGFKNLQELIKYQNLLNVQLRIVSNIDIEFTIKKSANILYKSVTKGITPTDLFYRKISNDFTKLENILGLNQTQKLSFESIKEANKKPIILPTQHRKQPGRSLEQDNDFGYDI